MNKRGYEFSFSWIFTLMIGAVIIFLAIYAAFQFSDTLRFGRDSATAKKIGVILTPLETNLESGISYPLSLREETILFNDCVEPSVREFFGSQDISVAIKSDLARKPDEEQTPGVKSRFNNKYIFSENELTAQKEFYVFSKPLYYPFKIADLTILWSDNQKYCFVNPQADIEEEIEDLNLQNIEITLKPCEDRINVCFDGSAGCEIKVTTNAVIKDSDTLNYVESTDRNDKYALLFAAIFSDPKEYRCQMRRLAARAESLAELYITKSDNLGTDGCPAVQIDLENYKQDAQVLKGFTNPDFAKLNPNQLKNALCKLY